MPHILFHKNIAIADTAFTVEGKNEQELFQNAGIALISSMANIQKIKPRIKKKISLQAESLDVLLFDFLNEILLYKDSEQLLFSIFNVTTSKSNKGYHLSADIFGETADPQKHEISIDVKAVTMHMFEVKKTENGYEARVIIDI
jgi:SHS2 domain-containing protein